MLEQERIVNVHSLQSFYTETYFNDIVLSTATSFLYKFREKVYLITNWHVVSGKNTFNEELLNLNGAIPNRLRVYVPQSFDDGGILTGNLYWDICLYDDPDRMLGKKWYEKRSTVENGYIDIAIIPICGDLMQKKVFSKPIEDTNTYDDFKITIADDVFVIGYPLGLHDGMLPIWKRATIASEPNVGINKQKRFYIDTATREGMSGSPVVAINKTFLKCEHGRYRYATRNKFIGIYSGRVGVEKPSMAQLGIVWDKSLIDMIIIDSDDSSF